VSEKVRRYIFTNKSLVMMKYPLAQIKTRLREEGFDFNKEYKMWRMPRSNGICFEQQFVNAPAKEEGA
jgi:hypothetical protein